MNRFDDQGLNYLKFLKIPHGDIKPENILLDVKKGKTYLKICDFGGTSFLNSAQRISAFENKDFAGTIETFSPTYILQGDMELILEALQKEDKKALDFLQNQRDVFALGVTIIALSTGRYPFDTDEECMPILPVVVDKEKLEKLGYSSDFCHVLDKMTKKNPYQRGVHADVLRELRKIVEKEYPEEYPNESFKMDFLFEETHIARAQRKMRAALADPRIDCKECYYICKPYPDAEFYTFCALIRDFKTGEYKELERFIKFDSTNNLVHFYEHSLSAATKTMTIDELKNRYGRAIQDMPLPYLLKPVMPF